MTAPAPRSGRRFLTARWQNLILANFPVPKSLLQDRLPPGTELDTLDGEHWVSLVGFQYVDTRVLGVSWPGYRHFPELNLRFYVRRGEERGVCFVREYVPKRLVAWMAWAIYHEDFHVAPVTASVTESAERITADYTVHQGGQVHRLAATGTKPAIQPAPGSRENWFKEHIWGYGTSRRGKLIRYEVSHPEWEIYPVLEYEQSVDWSALYGPKWSAMTGTQPASVVFAVGSEIRVFPRGT